jgi:hypothetical protein
MPVPTPYHAGERLVQAKAGQSDIADRHGQLVQNSIMFSARPFLAEQEMVVLGSWDGRHLAWPTLLFGRPGFVRSEDGKTVHLDISGAGADADDPLWSNLRTTGLMSILAIDLGTRRRLRINGRVEVGEASPHVKGALSLMVEQAYPNCPKYIQRRRLRMRSLTAEPGGCAVSTLLSAHQQRVIAEADTAFVATVHPDQGTDVSHRGGSPGFVTVESPSRLRIPDYAGNSMFNTLGNISATGLAGLLFVDFAAGRQFQVAGRAKLDWERRVCGSDRSWTLDVEMVRESALAAQVHYDYVDASPFNPLVDRGGAHS